MTNAIRIEKNQALQFYERMLLIRRFEEESGRLYMQSKIKGFLHLYIGQEAIAVGALSALSPEDYVVTHYRDHGHALARGLDPNAVMAELMGKATGCSGGKGGSMHLFDVSKGFMGGYAIVGGQLPIAAGLAFSIKYKKENRTVICFFGDGAVNQGEFHETMNLASMWKLPVVFFLENNEYGMGTHVERTHAAGKDIYLSADAYNMPSRQVDGMDILAVREATKEALSRVRSNKGPVFIEAMTYRFRGHSMADPSMYRDSAEVDERRNGDPIARFKRLCEEHALLDKSDLTQIESQVDTTVAEAVRFGEESDPPDPDSLYENVYG